MNYIERIEALEDEIARLNELLDNYDDDKIDPDWRLTRRERVVFGCLDRAKGKFVPKDVLIRTIFRMADNEPEDATNAVDVAVCRLRLKLKLCKAPLAIETIRHVGVRMRRL